MNRTHLLLTWLGVIFCSIAQSADRRPQENHTVENAKEDVTVVAYGADPTGKTDSSAAIQRMADDNTSAIVFPARGRFMINKTISLREKAAARKILAGQSFSHFGQRTERASIFAGPDLEGPMFDGCYIVKNLAFHAGNRKDVTCLMMNSYINRVVDCSFNGFARAIEQDGGTDITYAGNLFTGCKEGIRGLGKVATICRFENNQFQYVDDCINFDSETYSFTFIGNIFERVPGKAIHAKIIYDAIVIGNWWEHRHTGEQDAPPLSTSMNQQIMSGFAAGNHIQDGWRNIFADTKHSGRFGGVSVNNGQLVVRDSTGSAARLTQTGLRQEFDDWAGTPDFVIRSGHAAAAQRGARVVLQTPKNAPMICESYLGNEKWPFSGGIRLYRGKVGDQDLFTTIKFGPTFGTRVETDVSLQNGEKVVVVGATGLDLRWRSDGRSRGLELFGKAEETAPGEVTLDASSRFTFDNPMLNVTVLDRGIRLDGIDYIAPNGEVKCNGFKLYFVDAQGRAQTPREFHARITCDGN